MEVGHDRTGLSGHTRVRRQLSYPFRRVAQFVIFLPHPALVLSAGRAGAGMNDVEPKFEDEGAIRARVAELRQEHADLAAALEALEAKPRPDQIQLARFKKRKLILRDQIVKLEDQLTPDIIA